MNILDQLTRDEGDRAEMYLDQFGNLTIGVGHLLRGGHPLSPAARRQILQDDVTATDQTLLADHPWVVTLSSARHGVLLNMAFNMGERRLDTFQHALAALKAKDWEEAARQVLNSKWAGQVGERAQRIAQQLRTDLWV